MKCRTVCNILSDYLDGDLSPLQALHVREHLDGCPRCREEWRMLRQTVRLVGHLGTEKCPVDLRGNVLSAVEARPVAPGLSIAPLWSRFTVWSGAATGLAVVIAGVSLWRFGGPHSDGAIPPTDLPAVVAEAHLHEQYDLVNGLGAADGLLLAITPKGKTAERNHPAASVRSGP